jgi:hypothetical protein
MTTDNKNDLDVVDAIIHDAAMRDAEEGTSTPQQRRAEDAAHASIHARIAELRRSLLPAAGPPAQARPIRPALLALARDALLVRLETLTRTMGGAVQYAHRDLDQLSDDDLRRLIDLIETPHTAPE